MLPVKMKHRKTEKKHSHVKEYYLEKKISRADNIISGRKSQINHFHLRSGMTKHVIPFLWLQVFFGNELVSSEGKPRPSSHHCCH